MLTSNISMMQSNRDVSYSLIAAVCKGRLRKVRKLITSFGLSYSRAWVKGYVLLCYALHNRHAAVARLLLTRGSKVNRKKKNPSNTPLHFAARNGDIEIVEMLLDKHANIDAKNKKGRTPLHIAVKNEELEVTELLLKHGANVNAQDKSGTRPLHLAVRIGCLKIVKHLLGCEADVNCVCNSTWSRRDRPLYFYSAENHSGEVVTDSITPLHIAVENCNRKVVGLLLTRGANVDVKADDNITPLHIAAKKGYIHISEDLLNHGACIHSVTSKEGYTPLHFASELGNAMTVKLFLDRGADINASTNGNLTPLHFAAKKGFTRIVEDLLNHGACIHSLTLNEGYMPLHFASEFGNAETVKLFLDRDADITALTTSNLTPVHIATRRGHDTVLELLLQHSAKVDNEDKDGKTILSLAVEDKFLMNRFKIVEVILKYRPDINNQSNRSSLKTSVLSFGEAHKKIVEALLEYGFIVNPVDTDNPKLLHVSIKKGYLKIVEDLLKYGVDVNMLNNDRINKGFTPLHSAAEYRQEEIAKLLISYGADINAQDETGKTPIFYTIKNADFNVTRLLLTNKANVKYNPDLLNIAVEKECIEIVEALLQHNVDINASDAYGRTALHFTASRERKDFYGYPRNEEPDKINGVIAKMLLSKGAKVDAQTQNGLTTLYTASQYRYVKVAEALLEYNANPNCGIKRSNISPFHIWVSRGNEKITTMFLNNGADVNAKNTKGAVPLHIAIEEGHKEIVKVLLEYGALVDTIETPIYGGINDDDEDNDDSDNDIDNILEFNRTALHIATQQGYDNIVATLLEYGSDINITTRDNHTALDLAMATAEDCDCQPNNYDYHYNDEDEDDSDYNMCSCEETFKVLIRHLVKIKMGNLYVSEKNLQSLSKIPKSSAFQCECKEEIARMKNEKITNANISFWDILAKGTSSLGTYMRNENIVQFLESDDYKTKFPIYASTIKSHFRRGVERKELLEQGNNIFHLRFNNFHELPDVCIEKIFSYLSNKDLRILVCNFQNCNFQSQ